MKRNTLFTMDAVLPEKVYPDFSQLEKVLNLQEPDRPTLFEFFLNSRLHQKLSGLDISPKTNWLGHQIIRLQSFQRAGYDYVTVEIPGFNFTISEVPKQATISQNMGSVIHDQNSFDQYDWACPEETSIDLLESLGKNLPVGMKLIVHCPSGVLESAISLVGYENLCLLIKDNAALAGDIFAEIGTRLNRYYQLVTHYDFIGAAISNDDWGFKTQTLFSPEDMRKYVFCWHKEIVQTIHAAGKPAILHSCGYYDDVIEDIIIEMGYDAKHSFEDNIKPVEIAYEELHHRIAVLGGIDVDFVCRSNPQSVYERAKAMLNRSFGKGAYALGTGNSVPEYVPDKGYFAMIKAALEMR